MPSTVLGTNYKTMKNAGDLVGVYNSVEKTSTCNYQVIWVLVFKEYK